VSTCQGFCFKKKNKKKNHIIFFCCPLVDNRELSLQYCVAPQRLPNLSENSPKEFLEVLNGDTVQVGKQLLIFQDQGGVHCSFSLYGGKPTNPSTPSI
jgi:hypothetical protein